MLRITKIAEDSSTITMKLEGKLASDWVPLLETECLSWLKEKREVLLDFSDVTFVDGRGAVVLEKLAAKKIKVVACSDLIKELIKGEEKNE